MHVHSIWVSSYSNPQVWLLATPIQRAAVRAFASNAAQFTGQGHPCGLMTLGTYQQQCTVLYDGTFHIRGKHGGVRNVLIVPQPGETDGNFAAIHRASI